MNWSIVVRFVSLVTLLIGGAMAIPLVAALALGEPDAAALGLAVAVAVVPSAIVAWSLRGRRGNVGRREGLLIAVLSWVAASLVGAVPFWAYGLLQDFTPLDSFTSSLFEIVSGYTTTGATVIGNVEALPHGLLLWRHASQWLGGMGIIVLFVAILPILGIGAQELFRAEVPGTTKDKITPHLRDTARLLWMTYVGFSLALVLALVLAGMGWFDALCHTFTTMATGGFSTRNAGITAWDSPAIESVLTFFMVVAGLNFALHVRLVAERKPLVYLRDIEARTYLIVLAAATLIVAGALWHGGAYDGPLPAARRASFQVVSLMTTTGYNSADFHAWSAAAPVVPAVLVLLMFIGGCSGSTAGAMKVSRLIVAAKHVRRELARVAHPRAVIPVRINDHVVPEPVVSLTMAFIALYFLHFAVGVLLIAASGQDLVTSASAVAATLGNVGPGFGAVGPTTNYAHLPPFALWVLTYEMFVGRLELITILALVTRAFWRR